MKLKDLVNLHLLVILILAAGCENRDKNADTSTAPATTESTKENGAYTSFDPSKSVTAISPDLYKQLADTLNIRMLEGVYKPGDSSILHAHPDFALYVLEGSTVELTGQDGNKQEIEFKKGMAVILPATTHSAKNTGKSTLRLIVIEVNRPLK